MPLWFQFFLHFERGFKRNSTCYTESEKVQQFQETFLQKRIQGFPFHNEKQKPFHNHFTGRMNRTKKGTNNAIKEFFVAATTSIL